MPFFQPIEAVPHTTPRQWVDDSGGASRTATDGLDWQTSGLLVGVLMALGLARKFAPLLGPAGQLIAGLTDPLAKMFVPAAEKEAARKTKVAEESLWQIVSVIEQTNPDDPIVRELKKAISARTPAEFNALFDAWKKAREG
jgi:hypothetical protein